MVANLAEFDRGLVLFLDPAVLRRYGVPCTIEGVHPFVCLESCGTRSTWAALSSSPNHGHRVRVPGDSKRGHRRWIERDTYVYGPGFVYTGPAYAFQEASDADAGKPGNRNRVTTVGVALIEGVAGRCSAF